MILGVTFKVSERGRSHIYAYQYSNPKEQWWE